MDDLWAAVVAGLIAGIAVAMPLGAIGVLLVQEGMSGGWRPAAAAASGVALVDLSYCAAAVAAGTSLSRALDGWERVIHLTGAALLVLVAARGLLSLSGSFSRPRWLGWFRFGRPGPRPVRAFPSQNAGQVASQLPALGQDRAGAGAGAGRGGGGRPAWRVGLRFVGLTAVNPLTAVYFVALAAGLGSALDGWRPATAFVLAVFAASWAWQLTLAGFGTVAGARLPESARQLTGVAGYLVVLGYAARLALTG